MEERLVLKLRRIGFGVAGALVMALTAACDCGGGGGGGGGYYVPPDPMLPHPSVAELDSYIGGALTAPDEGTFVWQTYAAATKIAELQALGLLPEIRSVLEKHQVTPEELDTCLEFPNGDPKIDCALLVLQKAFLAGSAIICGRVDVPIFCDLTQPRYHKFTLHRKLCTVADSPTVCNPQSILNEIMSNTNLVAPAVREPRGVKVCPYPMDPSSECPKKEVILAGFNPILVVRDDPRAYCYTNETAPGHAFYPGMIERCLVERGGEVHMETVGTGTGAFAGLNENIIGPIGFGALDIVLEILVNSQIALERQQSWPPYDPWDRTPRLPEGGQIP